jgi:flotillin
MEFLTSPLTLLALVLGGFTFFAFVIATRLRRVVPTNEVHIVQSSKKTTSYGNATEHGNTYYEWPASLPIIGVTKTIMPVSNFDVDLKSYEAYDEGRLPFVVDVKAFFRISDSNMAAQRVANFEELLNQLTAIVQGAVRTVLASHSLEEIMQGRGKFGDAFTGEVKEQLKNWGVEAVKNIELMDIKDSAGSKVIHNIMEKKKSQIEAESRIEVAKNHRNAEIAEIEAKRETDLQAQEAEQQVGLRTVETKQQVALSNEAMTQKVKEQQRTTKEKEMAVLQVESLRKAEIAREVALVQAEQARQTEIVRAEATKQTLTLNAEGTLEAKKREAEGIAAEGKAKADAERAMLLAPVEAQTTLAKEIGENKSYQQYLITIKQVEANQAVGIAQADALKAAEIKVIANSGSASSGMDSVLDVLSSKGGTQVGAMLEGLANTDAGKALLTKILPSEATAKTPKAPVTNGRA